MKVLVQALLVGLFLATSAQGAVVKRTHTWDEDGKKVVKALFALPDDSFQCVVQGSGKVTEEKLHYLLRDILDGAMISEHDGISPLLNIWKEYVDTLIYTSPSKTDVIQIVKKRYTKKQVNKGTLAQPKLEDEYTAYGVMTCKKITGK